MVRLVDDLLDVSRITRNKLELRRERVTLATVIHSAVETSRPLIEHSGHTFSVTLTPTPVYLDADQVRLAQVFSNLLITELREIGRTRKPENVRRAVRELMLARGFTVAGLRTGADAKEVA